MKLFALQIAAAYVLLTRAFDEEPQGFGTVGGTQFCQGVTIHGAGKSDIVSAARVGSNCARLRIPWLVVQPEPIKRSEFCQTDSPATLRQRCDEAHAGEAMGAANMRRACWENEAKGRLQFVDVDELVYSVADPKFSLLAVLGEGTVWSLPVIDDDISNGVGAGIRPLDVNIEGMSCYLNNLYVYARVVVMRYQNVIKHWQLESALNAAAVHSKYYGWRSGEKKGINHWSQKSFQDKVLKTLVRAVRDTHDNSLRTSTAVDSDIPLEALTALGMTDQRGYEQAAVDWMGQGLDYMGMIAFPCRFAGAFNGGANCGKEVGTRALKLRTALEGIHEDAEVVVVSTGASTCRAEQQVSEADAVFEQGQFIRQSYQSSVGAGVSGFFYVGTRASSEPHVKTLSHITHPLWSLTDFGILSKHEQIANRYVYRAIGGAIEHKNWLGLSNWITSGGDTSKIGLSLLVGPFGLKDCPEIESDNNWALETQGESEPRASYNELMRMYREEQPLTASLVSETATITREVHVRYE